MNCSGIWCVTSNCPPIIAATRLESSGTILMLSFSNFTGPLLLVHRGPPFVGVVPLQHDLGARLPALEAPRAGAVDRLDAVVLAQRLDALLVVDRRREHGELQQQVGERLVQLVLDRVGIGRAQFLDVAGAPGQRRLELGAGQPLEGVDHVLGGELLAAAEAHVVAQLEGVELAVGADRPRLGEIGDRRLAVPVHRHQRVLEHVHDVGGRRPGRALAVVMRRIERLHHPQGLRLRHRGEARHAKQRRYALQELTHRFLAPLSLFVQYVTSRPL